MKRAQIANLLAKAEGKKHQASVADIREVLKCLINLEVEFRLDDEPAGDAPLYSMLKEADDKYENEVIKRAKKAKVVKK